MAAALPSIPFAEPEGLYLVETIGAGAAWLDYDRDGYLDLYIARAGRPEPTAASGLTPVGRPNELYRNSGATFTRANAGIDDPGWAGGVAVGDIDNDGFPDLYVSNLGRDRMYRNLGDGRLEEMGPLEPGAAGWSASAAFVDLDSDGFLDLYVTGYVDFAWNEPPAPGTSSQCRFLGLDVACGPAGLPPLPDRLYHNRDGLGFEPWQKETLARGAYYGLGVVPIDHDNDGDLDIYVANDSVTNILWRNDAGTLRDATLVTGLGFSGDGREQAGMGVDAGDLDGDGDADLYVTNFSHDSNTLYVNGREALFLDRTSVRGLARPTLPMLGWSTNLFDPDADGDLDILVINGHVYPQVDDADLGTSYRQPAQVFLNDGRGSFAASKLRIGGGDPPSWGGRGAALGDMDNDGDLDVLVTRIDDEVILLRDDSERAGRWLGLLLVGRSGNRDAIGARVTARTSAGREIVRWAKRSGGFLSAHDPRLLIGLGNEEALSLEIRWPDGALQEITRPASGRWHRIVQP